MKNTELLSMIKKLTNDNDIAPKDLGKIVAITTCEAISVSLKIPSEPVGNPTRFYANEHKVNVLRIADTLNQYTLVDIDAINDMTFHLWLFRYKLVHATNDPKEGRLLSLILLGDSAYMPPAYTEALNKYPDVYLTRWNLERLKIVKED